MNHTRWKFDERKKNNNFIATKFILYRRLFSLILLISTVNNWAMFASYINVKCWLFQTIWRFQHKTSSVSKWQKRSCVEMNWYLNNRLLQFEHFFLQHIVSFWIFKCLGKNFFSTLIFRIKAFFLISNEDKTKTEKIDQ